MVLKKFAYNEKGKEKIIEVRVCRSLLSKFLGLMFRKKSPALLFVFKKSKKLSIHSFFCKPFKAIWLDEGRKVVKVEDVEPRKLNVLGCGKYLLEIPIFPTGTT